MDDLSIGLSPSRASLENGTEEQSSFQGTWAGHEVTYPAPASCLPATSGDLSEWRLVKAGASTFVDRPITSLDGGELEAVLGSSAIWDQVNKTQEYLQSHQSQATKFYRQFIQSQQQDAIPKWSWIQTRMTEALEVEKEAFSSLSAAQTAQGNVWLSLSTFYQSLNLALLEHEFVLLELFKREKNWQALTPYGSLRKAFLEMLRSWRFYGINGREEEAFKSTLMVFELLRRAISHEIMEVVMTKDSSPEPSALSCFIC